MRKGVEDDMAEARLPINISAFRVCRCRGLDFPASCHQHASAPEREILRSYPDEVHSRVALGTDELEEEVDRGREGMRLAGYGHNLRLYPFNRIIASDRPAL